MIGDIADLGQYIGAGLAAIGSGIAAIGVGNVASNFLAGALRNPSAAASQTATLFRSPGDLCVPRRTAVDVRGLIQSSYPDERGVRR
jgi:hypothetical protein